MFCESDTVQTGSQVRLYELMSVSAFPSYTYESCFNQLELSEILFDKILLLQKMVH